MDRAGGGLEEHGHQVKRSALEIWCPITLEEMLALFQKRVVDAVGENHCDQRVIHITDPRIIRPAFALRLVGEYLRGANQKYKAYNRTESRNHLSHTYPPQIGQHERGRHFTEVGF